jgi:hypothetical protein
MERNDSAISLRSGVAFTLGVPGMKPGLGGLRGQRGRGAVAQLLGLVGFDVLEPIDDSAAELEKPGPLADPSPTLQGACADVQTLSELALVEMLRGHAQLLQLLRKRAPKLARPRFGEGAELVRRKVRKEVLETKNGPHIGGPWIRTDGKLG